MGRHNALIFIFAIFGADIFHFGFEGDQHIADFSFNEAGGSATTAGIKYGNIAEQLADKFASLGIIATILLKSIGIGCQIGVTGVAGCFRVREDQLYVIAHQIAPVLDALRVAFTHKEGREGKVGAGVVWQILLPAFGNKPATVCQNLHIEHLVEGHDIGLETLHDGAGPVWRSQRGTV